MSMVRFASLCDKCGVRSEEYSAFPMCRECDDHTCPNCEAPEMRDDERGTTECIACNSVGPQ